MPLAALVGAGFNGLMAGSNAGAAEVVDPIPAVGMAGLEPGPIDLDAVYAGNGNSIVLESSRAATPWLRSPSRRFLNRC